MKNIFTSLMNYLEESSKHRKEADDATIAANLSNKKADHQEAANAHMKAMQKAIQNDDEESVKHHSEKYFYHRKKS